MEEKSLEELWAPVVKKKTGRDILAKKSKKKPRSILEEEPNPHPKPGKKSPSLGTQVMSTGCFLLLVAGAFFWGQLRNDMAEVRQEWSGKEWDLAQELGFFGGFHPSPGMNEHSSNKGRRIFRQDPTYISGVQIFSGLYEVKGDKTTGVVLSATPAQAAILARTLNQEIGSVLPVEFRGKYLTIKFQTISSEATMIYFLEPGSP